MPELSISPFFYALMATICFSYASTIFTEFSRKISPLWMNSFKAFMAFFAFTLTALFISNWRELDLKTILALLSSGCIGLMIGDIFLLHAMKEIGASRMLMIFGLQPFLLGLGGYYLFDQKFSLILFVGVSLMMACLYTISLESYKKSGHWQWRGLIYGLAAVFLDAVGVLLTKYSFNANQGISTIQVNVVRCLGAIIGFGCIYFFNDKFDKKFDGKFTEKLDFKFQFKKLTQKEKFKLVLGSLAGTYLSLMLYLTAVSKGQLSVVSSVTSTGPMFAATFECLRDRKWPSLYLVVAFIFFISGFFIFSIQ